MELLCFFIRFFFFRYFVFFCVNYTFYSGAIAFIGIHLGNQHHAIASDMNSFQFLFDVCWGPLNWFVKHLRCRSSMIWHVHVYFKKKKKKRITQWTKHNVQTKFFDQFKMKWCAIKRKSKKERKKTTKEEKKIPEKCVRNRIGGYSKQLGVNAQLQYSLSFRSVHYNVDCIINKPNRRWWLTNESIYLAAIKINWILWNIQWINCMEPLLCRSLSKILYI